MCLLPPSLAPCLSSPPSVLPPAHTLTCPFSLTPALPSAPVLWKILLTCQEAKGIPLKSSPQLALSWSLPGQPTCKDRRWSQAMEKGKGADDTMKANLRCFSPSDRQSAHHQTGTSTGSSSVFYWAKTHIYAVWDIPSTKMCHSSAAGTTTLLGASSSKCSKQIKNKALNMHCCPLLKALPSLNTTQLITTNHCGSCKIQVKIQQKFWGLKEPFYRDRENRWLIKASRKSLSILSIIQTQLL